MTTRRCIVGKKRLGKTRMKRRSVPIVLTAAIALLSIGQAYHYHPDGGKHWYLVALPSAPASADTPDRGAPTPAHGSETCLLHFWSFLFSTISILLLALLLPPARKTILSEPALYSHPAWTGLSLSIRGPPAILA